MKRQLSIQWTDTAKEGLRKLPRKARAGIIAKADELSRCADPRRVHKPLQGPLQGYYRLTYGRFRAIFTVEEERLVAGKETLLRVRILFVVVGIRKEHDKSDVYRVAKKLADLGILNVLESGVSEETD